ncbi:hypothetical protein [Lentilactobacillus buchneri]|uniref:Exonuclease SbcC n=1 Tax=Lentilactobacillus buchneri DSM 20057 TaxID=1423728 RepID=A0A4V3A410_LENBU|nr:hypothetical protein [Lentilactobacillus buchneri]WCJ51832.1 hypothetical protein OKF32_00045 [Lentilactobacillus sp. Egmn17]AEB73415.1 hypothetical protein Lbuc_1157 [Lentilactobacillus buchneri NRRL B-30929]KRK67702.1 hypothetical protein FC79_GL001400 [Lentilactobacillus buchneri DSM 20057]MCT2881739.1 hypothetical protein [Lentilactobacillus buchneri]MCT2899529.1 hypothetical protein [Lentilactobacillus buchneri]
MDNKIENDPFSQNDSILASALSEKVKYLSDLNDSIKNGNDLKVYELMDPNRFATEVKGEQPDQPETNFFGLAADLKAQLSHHLSDKLIDYLGTTYPFFYYHEYDLGKFNIYFGNWWDHRMFGELDTINVRFNFAEDEYNTLAKSFELEAQNKRVNDDQMRELGQKNEKLTQLIEDQTKRDQRKEEIRKQIKENEEKSPMPWEAGKVKEEHQQLQNDLLELTNIDEQASGARSEIKKNENQILALSKEETIYNLEKQNIRASFGSFEAFIENNNNLYAKYLQSLSKESQVTDGE